MLDYRFLLYYLLKNKRAEVKKSLNIVADENMPHIENLFGEFANISKLPGREITPDDVKHADAVLCRSITQIDQTLLQNSKVQFVGTATIGIDHLDTAWLNDNNITWSSAAGCNAAAVAQYVISAICYWLKNAEPQKELQDIKVGIIGAGNVGSELARCLDILGIEYLLSDPPLQKNGDKRKLVSIDKLLTCDVITLHVPISRHGKDSTFHMIDEIFLKKLSTSQVLINAARGEVVDNLALVNYLKSESAAAVVLDVFENEPNINFELAKLCLLSTPHIAGHTLEGKLRGSYLIYQAFCRHFELPIQIEQDALFPKQNTLQASEQTEIEVLLSMYDINKDVQKLLSFSGDGLGLHFDQLRKNYVAGFGDFARRDYSGWLLENIQHKTIERLVG